MATVEDLKADLGAYDPMGELYCEDNILYVREPGKEADQICELPGEPEDEEDEEGV